MKRVNIWMGSLIFLICLGGCKWRDDFRDRAQPQMLTQPERGTLNIDSTDYTTNPILEEEEIQETPIRCIDGLSTIPPVPEHPCGL